jgi:hypothetical protein
MKPTQFLNGIGLLLLLAGFGAVLAQDTRAPDTIPPSARSAAVMPLFAMAVVVEVNRPTGEITYQYTHLRQVVVTETGQDGTRVQRVNLALETIQTTVPVAGFSFFDAKGRELTVDASLGRAKKADVMVIYRGGRLPDPRYLRVFKDDTLVLVCGDKSIAPISADIITSGYVPNRR